MDPVWLHLFDSCNEYAAAKKIKTSRGKLIQFASLLELRQFVAVLFTMGIIRLPEINDHFSNENDSDSGLLRSSYVQSLITENRYLVISFFRSASSFWCLHKIFHARNKCKELQVVLNSQFQHYWTPNEHIAVDEIMMLFKGRFGARQHVRGTGTSHSLTYR